MALFTLTLQAKLYSMNIQYIRIKPLPFNYSSMWSNGRNNSDMLTGLFFVCSHLAEKDKLSIHLCISFSFNKVGVCIFFFVCTFCRLRCKKAVVTLIFPCPVLLLFWVISIQRHLAPINRQSYLSRCWNHVIIR